MGITEGQFLVTHWCYFVFILVFYTFRRITVVLNGEHAAEAVEAVEVQVGEVMVMTDRRTVTKVMKIRIPITTMGQVT